MQSYINAFQEAFDIKGEVGRLVDAATCETLVGPDWQLNMQIVQKVNSSSEAGYVPRTRKPPKKNPHLVRLIPFAWAWRRLTGLSLAFCRAKDAAKTLRKRLLHTNPRIARNALTLTETLVQNCGRELHAQIATREFMDDVKAMILNPVHPPSHGHKRLGSLHMVLMCPLVAAGPPHSSSPSPHLLRTASASAVPFP